MDRCFLLSKIHPEDALKCSTNGVSILKILDKFSSTDKFSHKLITEYRMLNSQNQYVRLIEQYQVLELDSNGQIWLMLNIVDISSNQEEFDESQSQLLNFRTGEIIPLDTSSKTQVELTKREKEVCNL
ncbi:hypothetical protein A9996_19170 [Gelidibacter algens]|uniref:hypothetical protein n=1 Tax=Gelidibacter algens TaxID=49280 RepID=UPI000804BC4B|nr:hypothetical protein [Gelidibacter algens]OBX17753.1 hypothetical protein A9996_19170 [Gelidibacter algens]